MHVTEEFIDGLLASTSALFNNIYAFECTLHAMPGKSHCGLAIAHQDLKERREDFVRELRFTMSSWVYSKSKYKKIVDDAILEREGDKQNADFFIHDLVRQKFRRGHPKGQFGELLLFNVIQHYFKAAPLLRKMPITTNPAIERHGADAIHYRPITGGHLVYVGEAKTYGSKSKFTAAIKDAVDSILDAYDNLSKELGLYVYDDFIDDGLLDVARAIKNNTASGVKFELVCIVSYEENKDKSRPTESEIKIAIREAVEERMKAFDVSHFSRRCPHLLSRLHLFAVPVWGLDGLMEIFDQ